jgi:hypothetical protein
MTPERLDHMTVQYVWGLENDQVFMLKGRHEAQRGNFSQFRRLVGSYIMPIRKMLDEDKAHALSGVEWSFLYLEMWKRLGGSVSPGSFSHSNNYAEFDYQLDRLTSAGYCLTYRGVERRQDNKNPCAEISLGEPQPCTLQEPQQENAMNDYTTGKITNPVKMAPAFETKNYIFGNDVEHMSEEALIQAIKRVEEQITDLKAVKTKSTKIAANIAKLQEQLDSIVAELDKR